MEHARHVVRVALVVVVAIAAVSIARGLAIPKSYGMYGSYRYDNVAEHMNERAVAHRGPAACGECHSAEFQKRAGGSHRTVSCEVCHGPLAFHVKDDGTVDAPKIDRSYTLCARCHRRIEGRPAAFPQVVLEEHVQGPLEANVCISCHDPHSPKL